MTKAHALTGKWAADIDARLAALQKVCEAASNDSERDYHLLGVLNLCGPFRPLPEWALAALRKRLISRLPQPPVDWVRWNLVLALRDVSGLTWEKTFERASELLERTPAAGGIDAMRKSYERIESSLPPEWRRKRTYRRKPPLR